MKTNKQKRTFANSCGNVSTFASMPASGPLAASIAPALHRRPPQRDSKSLPHSHIPEIPEPRAARDSPEMFQTLTTFFKMSLTWLQMKK